MKCISGITAETYNFVKDESKSIQKSLPILLAGIILLSFLSFGQPVNADSASFNQLSITITLEASDFDSFIIWITPYKNFGNFTFALSRYENFNSSQLFSLTQIGEVIPHFTYIQTWDLSERESVVDNALAFFSDKGISIKGVMAITPVSYTHLTLPTILLV